MAQSLALAEVELACRSFRGAVDAMRQYTLAAHNLRRPQRSSQLWKYLLGTICP